VLFFFKIIGGSDGKLIVFIFITEPLNNFHYSHMFIYFLAFCILFFALISINYLLNTKAYYKDSFDLLYGSYWYISSLKKFFIKFFYQFLSFSKIRKLEQTKYELKSFFLFYNIKSGNFHLLIQNRKPLILICVGSYYFLLLFKLFF
jgi:hypothetical protein